MNAAFVEQKSRPCWTPHSYGVLRAHHAHDECDGLHNPERVHVIVLLTSEQDWQREVSLRLIILLLVTSFGN